VLLDINTGGLDLLLGVSGSQAVEKHVGLGAAGCGFTHFVDPVVVALVPLTATLDKDHVVASLQSVCHCHCTGLTSDGLSINVPAKHTSVRGKKLWGCEQSQNLP